MYRYIFKCLKRVQWKEIYAALLCYPAITPHESFYLLNGSVIFVAIYI